MDSAVDLEPIEWRLLGPHFRCLEEMESLLFWISARSHLSIPSILKTISMTSLESFG